MEEYFLSGQYKEEITHLDMVLAIDGNNTDALAGKGLGLSILDNTMRRYDILIRHWL